jgi:hypothetical protein
MIPELNKLSWHHTHWRMQDFEADGRRDPMRECDQEKRKVYLVSL